MGADAGAALRRRRQVWSQHRVVHPPRTRQPYGGVRGRDRGGALGSAAGRGGAGAPVPLFPGRRRNRRDPARASGSDPYDRALTDRVGRLATRSDGFRTRWAAHDVREHFTGVKHFHPQSAGAHLLLEALEVSADIGLLLYDSPEPGSSSAHAIRLLARWAANEQPALPTCACTSGGTGAGAVRRASTADRPVASGHGQDSGARPDQLVAIIALRRPRLTPGAPDPQRVHPGGLTVPPPCPGAGIGLAAAGHQAEKLTCLGASGGRPGRMGHCERPGLTPPDTGTASQASAATSSVACCKAANEQVWWFSRSTCLPASWRLGGIEAVGPHSGPVEL
jgi:hypothetical protein